VFKQENLSLLYLRSGTLFEVWGRCSGYFFRDVPSFGVGYSVPVIRTLFFFFVSLRSSLRSMGFFDVCCFFFRVPMVAFLLHSQQSWRGGKEFVFFQFRAPLSPHSTFFFAPKPSNPTPLSPTPCSSTYPLTFRFSFFPVFFKSLLLFDLIFCFFQRFGPHPLL